MAGDPAAHEHASRIPVDRGVEVKLPKNSIVQAIGEQRLLLPELLEEALAANERVKYLLTLLQDARSSADGAQGLSDLREQRLACGLEDDALDGVIAASQAEPGGRYRIPGAEAIVERVLRELRAMLAPLHVAGEAQTVELDRRSEAIARALRVEGDLVRGEDLERLVAPPSAAHDSAHALVMDAHRALNALEAKLASETIDGARAHGLADGDRQLVRAFMRGVHRTERLRLDHPGLGTTATRSGPALVIENDLGETDAHIVVIRVVELTVTISYTDIHLQRLIFLQELLRSWGLSWADTRTRSDPAVEGGLYHLARGHVTVASEDELAQFLEHLGSRMVFLIDWNRARKRLRPLVGGRAAVELLQWAAEHEYGHIAFLRAGSDRLVYDAMQFAGARFGRSGGSLRGLLGTEQARSFMQAVLRICADGLTAGRPVSLVQDEVRAELAGHLRSARQETLALMVRHAEIAVEIAELARDALERAIVGDATEGGSAAAAALQLEHEADRLVEEVRAGAARSLELHPFLRLIEAADDIADCLEEAVFYATLLPAGRLREDVRIHARTLARLVLQSARAYLRAIALSTELRRGGPQAETEALLEAAHEAIALEHATDEAQRAVHTALVRDSTESASELFATVELTRSLEEAADALMHSAYLLREDALARLLGSETAPRNEPAAGAPAAAPPAELDPHVYVFGDSPAPIPDVSVIGAKAYGLARMARAHLPVPEAVVLRSSLARELAGPDAREVLRDAVASAIAALEQLTRRALGSARAPLLLSARSGAPASMPGMLETVVNVGMCERTLRGLIAETGNPRLAWDTYRRFIESFAVVVHGCPRAPFAAELRSRLQAAHVRSPRALSAHDLERVARANIERFKQLTGQELPEDPLEQVLAAVAAVVRSWDSPRARRYREMNEIPDEPATAVILQRMVFGNAGGISGSGVGFTRDPSLGTRQLYLDFLLDAQGEDIVGGHETVEGANALAALAPAVLSAIERVSARLELEFRDAQEFELTVQNGELFLLQTRAAKRTPWAALKIAVDQVHEGLISPEMALARLRGLDVQSLRRRHLTTSEESRALAHALPASSGVAAGPLALDREAAERMAAAGTPPVLVRPEASTADLAALAAAAGLLTKTGSRTSHAAVVARELDKPCLVGCEELEIDMQARTVQIGGRLLAEGEEICLDGDSGGVFAGEPRLVEERPEHELAEVAGWEAQAIERERPPKLTRGPS